MAQKIQFPYFVWKAEPHDKFGIAPIKRIFGIAYSTWFFFGFVTNYKSPQESEGK